MSERTISTANLPPATNVATPGAFLGAKAYVADDRESQYLGRDPLRHDSRGRRLFEGVATSNSQMGEELMDEELMLLVRRFFGRDTASRLAM
jgi:hypothetical protein